MNDSSNDSAAAAPACFAGVDVCSARLDVRLLPEAGPLSFPNTPAGLAGLVTRLKAAGAALVVMEATGGLEALAAAHLAAAGVPLAVVNPRQVRDFARAVGVLAKTDAIDAAVLARFARDVRPPARPLPTDQERLLSDLLARRRQLVEARTAESNRLTRAAASGTSERVRRSLADSLAFLDRQLKDLDGDIDRAARDSPAWRDREDLLRGVPGVGKATARTLLAEMPELGTLTRQQAAALAGLAPFNRDSGTMRGRRTTWGGRAVVRTALYMATLTATRCNPAVRATYQRLRAQGKAFKVAITACMRKLLAILNAMLKNMTPWEEPMPA